jgi:hypothetical protein
MSSFSHEFKKYRKQERFLTGAVVILSVLAPITLTTMMNYKVHWAYFGIVGAVFLTCALVIKKSRQTIAEKLLAKYETLDVGSILAKKIVRESPRRFVVTNRGYNHFYLKCLNTGEQVLVSKSRIREDFDIAN